MQIAIGIGLTLGLAWFDIWRLAPDVQIQIAIGLGLTLGLARFGSVWLGLARFVVFVSTQNHMFHHMDAWTWSTTTTLQKRPFSQIEQEKNREI